MKKGEKSNPSDRSDKGKLLVEEKGKRTSRRTRIKMDFDPKTSKLRNKETVDKYLAMYDFHWGPGIKIEFCPNDVDVSSAPPGRGCIYASPSASARIEAANDEVHLQILIFYEVTPS